VHDFSTDYLGPLARPRGCPVDVDRRATTTFVVLHRVDVTTQSCLFFPAAGSALVSSSSRKVQAVRCVRSRCSPFLLSSAIPRFPRENEMRLLLIISISEIQSSPPMFDIHFQRREGGSARDGSERDAKTDESSSGKNQRPQHLARAYLRQTDTLYAYERERRSATNRGGLKRQTRPRSRFRDICIRAAGRGIDRALRARRKEAQRSSAFIHPRDAFISCLRRTRYYVSSTRSSAQTSRAICRSPIETRGERVKGGTCVRLASSPLS